MRNILWTKARTAGSRDRVFTGATVLRLDVGDGADTQPAWQPDAWASVWHKCYAMYRETMRGPSDPEPCRLGQGLRGQGRCRWDDLLQAFIDLAVRAAYRR